jgi:large subunit ribosomal protein L10
MKREEKAQIVGLIKGDLLESDAVFLVNYQGLTVAQMQSLRGELRREGGSLRVAKARLMKRAAQEVESAEGLSDHFKGQVGVVFSSGEVASVAKVLSNFSKNNESLSIVAGKFDSHLLDAAAIIRLGSLPPKKVLYAQVCMAVKSPLNRLAFVCNMQILKLLWTLNKIKEKQG